VFVFILNPKLQKMSDAYQSLKNCNAATNKSIDLSRSIFLKILLIDAKPQP
jgi:hypothetical protein